MDKLTESERKDMKEAFQLFDKNGDGTITLKELRKVVQSMGQNPTDAEIKEMIARADKDGNGYVDFDEFVMLVAPTYKDQKSQEQDLREAFKYFDKNGDNYITSKELRFILTRLGETMTAEDADNMIREGDKNGDGKINYEEFVTMFCEKLS